MKKILLLIVFLASGVVVSAQGVLQDTTVALLGSFTKNMLVWKPPLYVSAYMTGCPIQIHFPGQGESSGAASGLRTYGIMNKINAGWQPYAVNGKLPIIVAVQTGDYPSEAVVQDAVTRIRAIYRCDTNMLSVHGFSMGGQSTMWPLASPAYGIPACFLVNYQGVSIGTTTGPHNLAMNYVRPLGKKVWAIEGASDLRDLELLIDTVNANFSGAGKYTKITSGAGSTHDGAGWTRLYDTANKWTAIGNMNAYEYTMLQTKGGNLSPVANAGADSTITLPRSTVNVLGSGSTDSDGTITGYSWTKTSGPGTYTITSASSANTTITGLVEGAYVFTLTVTDNSGATNADTVTIIVNAAAPTITKSYLGLIIKK